MFDDGSIKSIHYRVSDVLFDNVGERVGRATKDLLDVKCPKFSLSKICRRWRLPTNRIYWKNQI